MCGMDLDDVEARIHCPARGGNEVPDHASNLVPGERPGIRMVFCGESARPDGLPAALGLGELDTSHPRGPGAGLAPGVRKLHSHDGPVRPAELDDGCPCIDMVVTPQAGVLQGVTTHRVHCGRLCHDEAMATDGQRPEPLHVPGVDHAVTGRVLAHRRDPQAVLGLEASDCDWAEEGRHGLPL